MWNQILQESQSEQKFDNASILVLGSRHTGKRTLIDGLCQISKTVLSKKKDQQPRIRNKSLVSAIDYAYVNGTNLNDPDNKMNSKLQFYLVDDESFKTITQLLIHNPQILSKLVIIIALDSAQPWTFMVELDKWINFINQLLIKAGLPITKLDEMKANIQNCYKHYKQPQYDEHGKLIKKLGQVQTQSEQLTIPIPQDILINNIRIPLIVTVTKADLQSSILRQKVSEKISYIQYHLRKFCLNYGGSLVYVSNRNHTNLDILYEYLLHRVYGFPLRFKAETVNQQSIFVPLGADNLQLLNDSIKVAALTYNQMIPIPITKKQVKQQVQVEDDNEFFQKFIKQAGVSKNEVKHQQQSIVDTSLQTSNLGGTTKSSTTAPTQIKTEQKKDVEAFYKNLLMGNTKAKTNLSSSKLTQPANKSINISGVLQKKPENKQDKPQES